MENMERITVLIPADKKAEFIRMAQASGSNPSCLIRSYIYKAIEHNKEAE